VTAQELLGKQPELDKQLKTVGPVTFVRNLIMNLGGAALHSLGQSKLAPGKMATLFSYEDGHGGKLRISVVNELLPTGQNRYELLVEPDEG
jgi:hypothetical protein